MILKGESKIDKIEKIDKVINIISKALKEILNESPDFTGDIHLNFFMGGLANINKTESLKIK